MAHERENPEMTDFGEDVTPGSEEKENLPSRIERYSRAKHFASRMQRWLEDNDCPEAAALGNCGNWLVFRWYYTVDKVRLYNANFCKLHLLCPLCAIRRGAKLTQTYLDKFQALTEAHSGLHAYMVTLTVRNDHDLAERFEHLKKGLQVLNRKRRDGLRKRASASQWCKVLAAVGAYEATIGKNSGLWHPHFHAVVLATEPINQELLRDEWFKITGDSHQVKVDPLHNPDNPALDFVEVFKYALKFSTMTHEKTYEAHMTLKGKRLVVTIGEFRGLKIPEDLTDTPLHDLPFVEYFYRYFPESGFNLQRTERSEDLE